MDRIKGWRKKKNSRRKIDVQGEECELSVYIDEGRQLLKGLVWLNGRLNIDEDIQVDVRLQLLNSIYLIVNFINFIGFRVMQELYIWEFY